MPVGEVFLAAFLQLLLDRLTPLDILNYFGNFPGVGKKLEKWRASISTIAAVLSDAEERQRTDNAVKLWLNNLRDLAYDVEDMLDKFATQMLKRMIEGRDQASTSNKVRNSLFEIKLNWDMNSEMKKITERLQDISDLTVKFGLKDTWTSAKESRSLPSSGLLDEKLVVGRDGDKGKIIELLKKSTNFGVVAIVGMTGVGKTTLAQLVFNSKNAMREFDLKVWVSVSDDFHVVRVTKAILESITSQPVQVEAFSKMQQDLSEQLRGKRFLIVLDDIWNKGDYDLYDLWIRFQSPFGVGVGGSKIIVTTRDVNVAKIMGAAGVHNLECMEDDDCMEIFERHAFGEINSGKPVNYKSIRTKIVEKCCGLPLAARTLGGLLRCEEKEEWGEILDNKLWNLADKSGILPVLQLSYDNLPSYLKRLQDISERKDKFGLKDTGTSAKESQSLPSSDMLDEELVVGRDGDKVKIIELLSRKYEHAGAVNFGVVAIVGMTGVGKTTLAQLVFNSKNAMMEFDLKAWVSVSDDFHVVRVTKAILESITSQPVQVEAFSKMQQDLSEQLRGKKFLIVLDDIWNRGDYDLYDLWTRLQSPFGVGAGGSKIIVTTRDVHVARTMGATGVHNLECMADDDCLEIFERHAFGEVKSGKPVNYELIRTKIVEKCCGLPLAARTLGGLLRRNETDEWGEILDNKLWNLADNSSLHPVPKLSYHYLPSHLKRCFAYCSILPNDYEFGEKQLILLWMAEGLIQQNPDDSKQMEDLGRDYFRELLARSLFQESSKNNSRYVMPDLVNDLAQWAAGEICFRLEDKQGDNLQSTCFRRARHSSFIAGEFDGVMRFDAFPKAERLRTFLPLSLSDSRGLYNFLSRKVTFELLPQLQYLRVLSFNGYKITELPKSIGDLRLLQYLDLSYTEITSLPKSTSTLYNLQTLILEGCSKLKSLPANMSNLIKLRHLNNSGASSLEGMPLQLGRLTNLQSLPLFVVSEGSDQSGIREIGPLLHLRGTLCLSRLENVTDVEDARRANLKCKERLDSLVLKWSHLSDTRETESAVLDMLQPHTKLKELTIKSYAGEEFSSWVGGPLFSNMVLVCLEECKNCSSLPPLGQLPHLKELHIRGMNAVESVGAEFYGGECVSPFPLLEILEFVEMQHWKEWLPFQLDHGSGVFPCLKTLLVDNCSKLKGKLPENLNSLAKLEIVKCEELVVLIANYKQLRQLKIDSCKVLVHTAAKVEFELLESLCLSNISEVMSLQTGELFNKGLTKVRDLKISGCEEVMSSLKNEEGRLLQQLTSLGSLEIEDNSPLVEELGEEAEELLQLQILEGENLLKLPKGLNQLSSLQELRIHKCSSLVSLPDVGLPPSLKRIEITSCDSLMYFAKFQIPQNLRTIEITNCKSLKSLVDEEECERLGLIAPNGFFSDNTNHCLESIWISNCQNLKSLPDGLCHLSNLQTLSIGNCGSLISIPRLSGGRRPSNLRDIKITECEKLEALPEDMHNLNSLETLNIDYREGLTFPPNLPSLVIWKVKSCKSLWELEWGLHRLISLSKLGIYGDNPDTVSFPPDMVRMETLLPRSLTQLHISGFPNLKKLSSKGFQFLTSLQSLTLWNCPKLESIPEEGLPPSLTKLWIFGCPVLKERCQPGKGRYWHKISHIPSITIDGNII